MRCRVIYNGFKIEVENTEDGYSMFCSRISDDFVLVDDWSPNMKNKMSAIKECKIVVDDFAKNPNDYL